MPIKIYGDFISLAVIDFNAQCIVPYDKVVCDLDHF